ncbi:hypothetical protein [Burkholderia paludis]|nr:hypothetical protein [Burkholderia paludis]
MTRRQWAVFSTRIVGTSIDGALERFVENAAEGTCFNRKKPGTRCRA